MFLNIWKQTRSCSDINIHEVQRFFNVLLFLFIFQSSVDIFSCDRDQSMSDHLKTSLQNLNPQKPTRPRPQITYLPESAQLVRALSANQVPKEVHPEGK